MRILVIGGGRFIGWHLVGQAMQAGHDVTVFNRGSASAPLGCDHRIGDRAGDLAALAHGTWDAVIDVCAYLPREVTSLAAALVGRADRYLLISTISVYAGFAVGNREDAALHPPPEVEPARFDSRLYGPLKVGCEQALHRAWPAAGVTIVRPGLVTGPRDPTGRVASWPRRFAAAAGGAVVVPGAPDDPVQFIDARDLAAFVLALVRDARPGTFNAAAPAGWTVGALADACASVVGQAPARVWVSAAAFARAEIDPWTSFPGWAPSDGELAGVPRTDVTAAVAAGLRCRSMDQTLADTHAWMQLPEAAQVPRAGLTSELERALLAALPA